jgi:hypothetical protein
MTSGKLASRPFAGLPRSYTCGASGLLGVTRGILRLSRGCLTGSHRSAIGSPSLPTYGYQIRGTPGFKIAGFAARRCRAKPSRVGPQGFPWFPEGSLFGSHDLPRYRNTRFLTLFSNDFNGLLRVHRPSKHRKAARSVEIISISAPPSAPFAGISKGYLGYRSNSNTGRPFDMVA